MQSHDFRWFWQRRNSALTFDFGFSDHSSPKIAAYRTENARFCENRAKTNKCFDAAGRISFLKERRRRGETALRHDTANSTTVDLFVIGGGINGTGIARDAAGRGLSVTLAEQGDLAQATSSASTKLFHGGLRYLE